MPRTPPVSRPMGRASDSWKRAAWPEWETMMMSSSPLVTRTATSSSPPRVLSALSGPLVVVADGDRDDAVGLDRGVVGEELGLLDLALARREHEVLALGEVACREHRLHALALAQRQDVHERAALRRALGLRQLVDLRPVDLAPVREEEQVV